MDCRDISRSWLLLLFLLPKDGEAKIRNFYVKAIEVDWDYAPTGENHGQKVGDDSEIHLQTSVDPPHIGRRFKKAVFRGYTDDTYTQAEARPVWMGILGPIFRGEVGDQLLIHFWNNASRNYSIHPHGVLYDKSHEGALYTDGTTGSLKMDDGIPPGGKYVYNWTIGNEHRPTGDDAACITYPYHSHVNAPKDTNTGLIGALLVCKKGTLDDNGKRKDVDKEYVLMFTLFDENLNYYLPETVEKILEMPLTEELAENEDFQESNKKHSINGLIYGNLEGLEFCVGEKISWHLFGMGSEPDLHSIAFEGQTMIQFQHRRNTISLFPAQSTTALMVVNENVGQWFLTCKVFDHLQGGMDTVFTVRKCNNHTTVNENNKRIKEYFLKAEEIVWDYAPSGINQLNGKNLTEDEEAVVYFERSADRIGGQYKKAVFIGYSDATFEHPLPKDPSLGILGPVIRAEEGDLIRVTFMNNASRNYSIQPMSVIDKNRRTDNEHSIKEEEELFLLFSIMNENLSHYLKENIELFCGNSSLDEENEDFLESNKMHSINGRMFGNLDGLDMCLKDEVTWYVTSVGDSLDLHTVYFYGNTFVNENNRRDSIPVISQSFNALLMKPDNPGKWIMGCRTNDHHVGGMIAFYTVNKCQQKIENIESNKTVRVYFIAAVEREWNFAPINQHDITGEKLSENEDSKVFYVHDDTHIGHIYKKALFREFTDETFKQELPQPNHLAMIGPFIKAEVGEEIHVVFKNMASREYSLHPHGVLYNNTEEEEKSVSPGDTRIFIWKVAERSGPTKYDPACITWPYYSDVDVVKDTNSGLIGPIVICRKGKLRLNGSRADMDREFALLFSIIDENLSWYLEDNIQKYISDPKAIDLEDEDFQESNKMHAINGLIYSNLKGLEMKIGEKAAFYLLGAGSENDLHTIHWHGQTILHRQLGRHRKDVVELFPGHVQTVEMKGSNNGTWLLHCHVNDHNIAGMVTTFTVYP